jgi:hypothetical protein
MQTNNKRLSDSTESNFVSVRNHSLSSVLTSFSKEKCYNPRLISTTVDLYADTISLQLQ